MNPEYLISTAASLVKSHFDSHFDERFTYHNWLHTADVRAAVSEIIDRAELTSNERVALDLAAIFHDAGYAQDPEHHEAIGAGMALDFINDFKPNSELAGEVSRLVLATNFQHNPIDKFEEIIRDADLSYLATDKYERNSDGLRHEWATTKGLIYSDRDWLRLTLTFLLAHSYKTQFALKYWQSGKNKNMRSLVKKLATQ